MRKILVFFFFLFSLASFKVSNSDEVSQFSCVLNQLQQEKPELVAFIKSLESKKWIFNHDFYISNDKKSLTDGIDETWNNMKKLVDINIYINLDRNIKYECPNEQEILSSYLVKSYSEYVEYLNSGAQYLRLLNSFDEVSSQLSLLEEKNKDLKGIFVDMRAMTQL